MSYGEMGRFQIVMDLIGWIIIVMATLGMFVFFLVSGVCGLVDEMEIK